MVSVSKNMECFKSLKHFKHLSLLCSFGTVFKCSSFKFCAFLVRLIPEYFIYLLVFFLSSVIFILLVYRCQLLQWLSAWSCNKILNTHSIYR